MNDITVPVPDDRVPEFYQFFGLWLAGALSLDGAKSEPSEASADEPRPAVVPWGSGEDDLADAVTVWKKYSRNAKALFGELLDNPEKKYTGEEIADKADIPHGAYGVAGALGWAARHGLKIGRDVPTCWEQIPETGESFYWIPADVAELFNAARAKVEGGDA